MSREMQMYVAISLRYEVEVGWYPYPMTQWRSKNRLYRFDNAELFSNLATAAETDTWSNVDKVLDDLIYGRSTDTYTLFSSGPYVDQCLGNDARLLVLSHTLDGCVEERDL